MARSSVAIIPPHSRSSSSHPADEETAVQQGYQCCSWDYNPGLRCPTHPLSPAKMPYDSGVQEAF